MREDSIPSQNSIVGYRAAGVDIDAGNAFVQALKPLARATARPGTAAGLGGFGALFDLKAAGFKDPILVATTDGVGTKLKIAQVAAGMASLSIKLDSIGVDLVAMCVNDLIVQGAEPLFFLDYFATGKLELGVAKSILEGVATACLETGCALVGGETAEMPGMYGPGEYDLAGFAVGATERGNILDGSGVRSGDVVLGLASSGLHSNGFSLVRRVMEQADLRYDAPAPFAPEMSLAEALLIPTRLYVAGCRAALKAGGVHALAHITGGGVVENIPRVLPDGTAAILDSCTWALPPVFAWLMKIAAIPAAEMARVFNCGIGMVAVIDPTRVENIEAAFAAAGERVFRIGHIERVAGAARTVLLNCETQWPG
jgi:phosphoribosylformylglycinamidine cyclo-ligase